MRFPETENNLHMPFLFRSAGQIGVAYSQCMPRMRPRNGKLVPDRPTAWKLHWYQPERELSRRIQTGMDERVEECSPAISFTKAGVQVSFIAAIPRTIRSGRTNGDSHALFTMQGPSLESLGPPVRFGESDCYCGFSRHDLTAMASGSDGQVRLLGQKEVKLSTAFTSIARLSYCFDAPSRLLITGVTHSHLPFQTIVFDLDSRRVLGELRIEGRPTYKPSLLDDIAIAPDIPAGRQPWRLVSGGTFTIDRSDISAFVA